MDNNQMMPMPEQGAVQGQQTTPEAKQAELQQRAQKEIQMLERTRQKKEMLAQQKPRIPKIVIRCVTVTLSRSSS